MAINEQDYAGYAIDPSTGRRHEIRHLPEQDSWEPGIYQFEDGDLLIGGVNGLDNLAINQLANRTLYLKNRLAEVKASEPLMYNFTIPSTGWQKNAGSFCCRLTLTDSNIKADRPVQIVIAPDSLEEAGMCGLSSVVTFAEGTITLYAKAMPSADINAEITIFAAKGGGGGGTDLPIATESTLGAVKIGQGLNVKADGTLSIDPEKVLSDTDMVNEEEVMESVREILDGDDTATP